MASKARCDYPNICAVIPRGNISLSEAAHLADTALKACLQLAGAKWDCNAFIEYGNRTRSLLQRARETGIPGIPSDWLEEVHGRHLPSPNVTPSPQAAISPAAESATEFRPFSKRKSTCWRISQVLRERNQRQYGNH